MRMLTHALALTGAAVAILAPSAAQAAPAVPQATTAYLGTYGAGRAGTIGEAGTTNGLWASTVVRPGAAGDDLIVTYTPRTRAAEADTLVYTALFNTVADPRAECLKVGADGVARKVWVSYTCRTGFAPNYSLLVR